MRKSEPQSLREVLDEAIRDCDMENELLRYRAGALWQKMMGEHIAAAGGRPFFRGDVMYVSIHNAALRHELMMMRSSMADALNASLKKKVVAEIRFIGGNQKQQ